MPSASYCLTSCFALRASERACLSLPHPALRHLTCFALYDLTCSDLPCMPWLALPACLLSACIAVRASLAFPASMLSPLTASPCPLPCPSWCYLPSPLCLLASRSLDCLSRRTSIFPGCLALPCPAYLSPFLALLVSKCRACLALPCLHRPSSPFLLRFLGYLPPPGCIASCFALTELLAASL